MKRITMALILLLILLIGGTYQGLISSGVHVVQAIGLHSPGEDVVRVSIASNGLQSDGPSYAEKWFVTENGRFITFESDATNLVDWDTNGVTDVFIHDRDADENGIYDEDEVGKVNTIRVSVDSGSGSVQGNGASVRPAVASGGRFIAFQSSASNLVAGDTNGRDDIFVRDLLTGQTNRVSVSSSGAQSNHISYAPSISIDGRFIAFDSDASNLVSSDTNSSRDIYLHDRDTDNDSIFDEPGQISTIRISVGPGSAQANNHSYGAVISVDGQYTVFRSEASNLVIGDTNGSSDIFVYDNSFNQLTRVSVASDGTEGNANSYQQALSGDGRFIAFQSQADNLVANDTNGQWDIFVHDQMTSQTSRVSVASNGTQGNGISGTPAMSFDGQYVTFRSEASNLVTGDNNAARDIFVHNRANGVTTRVSVSLTGTQANGTSDRPAISADGHYIAYMSNATNLVAGDTNASTDVFIYDNIVDNVAPSTISNLEAQTGSIIGSVDLSWAAPGDDANTGTATKYLVKYNTVPINEGNFESSTDITGVPIPKSAGSLETMTVLSLEPGVFYYFAIKTVDEENNTSVISNSFGAEAADEGGGIVFLPLIIKQTPITELYVHNQNTGGNVLFFVRNLTTKVEIASCTVSNNTRMFCGSFPPGTYEVEARTNCPPPSIIIISKTYGIGEETQPVLCAG